MHAATFLRPCSACIGVRGLLRNGALAIGGSSKGAVQGELARQLGTAEILQQNDGNRLGLTGSPCMDVKAHPCREAAIWYLVQ